MFLSSNHKNDNGSVAMSKLFVRRKRKQQINQLKKLQLKGIEDLLNCDLPFLMNKLKAFLVTQNDTPKMV